MEQALIKLYYELFRVGSLSGVERLYQRALASKVSGITCEKVREFFVVQQAYTLHRPARRQYKRNPIYVSGIDRQ